MQERSEAGLWSAGLDGLVGRDAVLAELRDLLGSGPRAAVVLGIAGAGKTSVLARTTERDAIDPTCCVIVIDPNSTGVDAHLSAILVRPGQRVAVGQPVGRVGASGTATGSHLHLELRVRGAAIDPLPAFR